ncbi:MULTISPECIES: succinate dehydrogenase hydrophobic membrane anchor subunit [unclassified Gordonia (in: high G+C Gram-positive bacteria)]|uniref:succinate dehydrogenase hydrophobic membrane anchor subunit n=1 Tax=unclassified Gordonia (in: high G+C Gram-positive bacteria) TaxID=2657482 RepID=UPI001FFFBE9B|nr:MULTISPECIES: succinate dehydrogenase hydrophobic membrane anchor subunit [unclassified Gordonia (in: high G+C Gram-positive bacteria)]UQE76192.1 succinate dehydrogenase hydrophobic membrane anchor subunit [Gordonia sp. PP30]
MTVEAKTIITDYDRPPSLDAPRAPRGLSRTNFEKWAWLFMRFSGMFLVILAIGHIFIMLAWSDGVHRIDAAFVLERWRQPFWQIWDLLMLWLAELHGANGLRTVIADYSRNDKTRFWLNFLLAISVILVLVLGTYALLTFGSSS